MNDVTLYHGDCLEILPTLEAGSVDAVITDPPYSSGGAFRGDRTGSTGNKYLGSHGKPGAGILPEVIGDTRDTLGWGYWATIWLSLCRKLLKISGYCLIFSDWRQLPNATNIIQSAGYVWRGIAVWDKEGSARPMSGRFAHQAEFIIWATNGIRPWDYSEQSHRGVYRCNGVSATNRNHQTEKPEEVMKWLIQITDEGDTILDPFMGSGTTGVACVQTGRKFIGIEIDENYYNIAKDRIAEAQLQTRLPI